MKKILLLSFALFLFGFESAQASLKIIEDYSQLGLGPTNCVGGGNDMAIIHAACSYVQARFKNANGPWTLKLLFKWSDDIMPAADYVFVAQGGTPNRQIEGIVTLNRHYPWYMDPTPLQAEGATNYVEELIDLGGGLIIGTRCYQGLPTQGKRDFFSTLIHEIGHGIGPAYGYDGFEYLVASSSNICVVAPFPCAGSVIPMLTWEDELGSFVTTHPCQVSYRSAAQGSMDRDQRVLLDDMSVLLYARMSGVTNIVMNLPEPQPTIKRAGGSVTVSWPLPVWQCRLQQCSDLKQANWSYCTSTMTESNGVCSVTVPASGTAAFFRLARF